LYGWPAVPCHRPGLLHTNHPDLNSRLSWKHASAAKTSRPGYTSQERAKFSTEQGRVDQELLVLRLKQLTPVQLGEPVLQLVRRSQSDSDVSRELRVGVEPAALSNVEVNRLRGANELVTESRAIAMTEPSNERIDAI